jgi:hypothetical protein
MLMKLTPGQRGCFHLTFIQIYFSEKWFDLKHVSSLFPLHFVKYYKTVGPNVCLQGKNNVPKASGNMLYILA